MPPRRSDSDPGRKQDQPRRALGLTAAGLVVRDTRSREADRGFGRGVSVEDGASVAIARALIERCREVAVFADGDGTSVRLADIVVRDTQSRESDRGPGDGLIVQHGASIEVMHALLERNREVSVSAAGAGTSVRLQDVVVRDTQSRESDQGLGDGLFIQNGASVEVARALFQRNRDNAIYVGDPGTTARLEDVVIRDTESRQTDAYGGRGVAVLYGAGAEVARALFERNRQLSVWSSEGASVRLEDVVLRDTLGSGGAGMGVGSASAQVARALVERSRGGAIYVIGPGAALSLEDVLVRETESRSSDGTGGRGIEVMYGAQAQVRRTRVEHSREVAVFARGAHTTTHLEDVVVTDTLPAACGERCAEGAGGVAVGSYDAATLSMHRFIVRHARLCGVQIAVDGQLDLSNGEVSQSLFGACVQVPDYRLSRLNGTVVYTDNGADVAGTDFPVPEVFGTLDGP